MLSAVSGVDERHSGLVSGVATTALQAGASVGTAALATIAATTSHSQARRGTPIHTAPAHGYTHVYQISALIIAAAIHIALSLLRLRPTDAQTATPAEGTAAAQEPAWASSASTAQSRDTAKAG